ncbi:MAG TPA: DNA adenine methylase [Longimicrobiales bacterium]
MRYIGNKTKLLDFIGRVLRARGIRPGTAVDPFTGTASVARALKRRGWRVIASDVMEYAYVFARAYVQVARPPDFRALGGDVGARVPTLGQVVAYLNGLTAEPGFLHRTFTPGGEEGRRNDRMYFTPENAAKVDTIRATLEGWRRDRRIDGDGFALLLAALLEAADRVANTAGVYAACIKSWQSNALRPLELRAPRVVRRNGCRALRADAATLVAGLEPFDLLYIDPPYNARQYPGYYHIPELIAMGWFDGPVRLRGKTGLLQDADKRSDWARRQRCEAALETLVASARCRHIVMSYNSEGIIPEPSIERILKRYGRAGTYRKYTRRYRRYRSDADGARRTYRGDSVEEYLFCIDR